jgi:hypothetical protein
MSNYLEFAETDHQIALANIGLAHSYYNLSYLQIHRASSVIPLRELSRDRLARFSEVNPKCLIFGAKVML